VEFDGSGAVLDPPALEVDDLVVLIIAVPKAKVVVVFEVYEPRVADCSTWVGDGEPILGVPTPPDWDAELNGTPPDAMMVVIVSELPEEV